ncbi:hypothetical protein BT96DRAFT_1007670 [Gymnopus androsaceus JB14]|uniref:Uncharacterized protein n=1 Tax=Gymnopus androsaceus JB14 TaxID=1447944 RepID=A0A6A4GGZ6_9AGAR|nr:hypothetical protein BT96DRAFT_1007670 [Gymnopus androsaceus JB14]
MLSQQLEGAPTYREKPRQQLEGLFFAKDISTFIQKELEDSMTNFELSVEEAAIIARLARQQQWLFDDENKMLQHKVLITKTLLELHQQRMNQVQQQAGQAADIELKVEDYIHRVRTTKGPNAQPKVNLEPDTDAEPPFDSEPDTDAESSDSEVEDWEMDQNEENFVVTCKDNMYTVSNGTPVRAGAGTGGARAQLEKTGEKLTSRSQHAAGRRNIDSVDLSQPVNTMAPPLKPVRRRSNKTQPPQAEARPARSVPRPDMAATSAGSAAHESYSSDAIGTSPYDDRMLNSGWNPGMGGRSYAGVHRDYSMGGATGYNMGMGGMGGMMASGMGGGMGGGGMGGGGMGGGSGTMGMGNMAGGMLGMVNTGGGMGNMGGDFGGIAGGMRGDFGSLGGDFRGIGSGFGAGTGWANNGAGTGGGWDNEFDFEKGIGRNEVDEVSEGEEERRAERSLHGIDVVEEHHQRNRFPQVPDPNVLVQHAQLQQFDGLDDEEIINDPEADLDGDGEFEGDGDQTQTLPPAASAGYFQIGHEWLPQPEFAYNDRVHSPRKSLPLLRRHGSSS